MYHYLARYYDQIHEQLQDDITFILTLAGQYGGPILEMGCGTGRVLIPLLKAGYEVIGIDNEKAMLDQVKRRLEQEAEAVRRPVQLVQADLRQLSLPASVQKANLILFTYNTALHFTMKEMQPMLRQIKKLMNADGCLFLDYANPFTIENAGIDEEPIIENTFLDPSTGASIIQKSQSRLDYAQQCLHTTWIFEMKDAISGKADRLDVEVDYWYLFPHQLQLVLQGAGFRLQHMMGGYDHAPFSEESERLLLLAVPAN